MALKAEYARGAVRDEKTGFEIVSDLCTGCNLCSLSCTYIKTGQFGMASANIKIERQGYGEAFVPRFTDDCDRCGFCLNYCGFEAIRKPNERRSWFVRARAARRP